MTERARGLCRKTREEIQNGNEMTVIRFQTGGRHQTYPAFLQGLTLVTAKQSFTGHWLMVMHHHTRFGY